MSLYLWDVYLLIILKAAIAILPCAPVSIDQIPVEPEQGLCVVEVRENLFLGDIDVQVLWTIGEKNKNIFIIEKVTVRDSYFKFCWPMEMDRCNTIRVSLGKRFLLGTLGAPAGVFGSGVDGPRRNQLLIAHIMKILQKKKKII